MKFVMAIIKPFRLEEVRQALEEAGSAGLKITQPNLPRPAEALVHPMDGTAAATTL